MVSTAAPASCGTRRSLATGYISTGGAATTQDLCARLGSSLRPGARVLDVGSGIGGAAFHLARTYGAKVTGIDLAEEMVAIALERVSELGMSESVRFMLGDVLETSFAEPFDIIWSRDAFMHIPDKARLFCRLHQLLAPGGRLVITDYARGKTTGSPEFEHYHREDWLQCRRAARIRPAAARPPGSRTSSSTTPPSGSSRFSEGERDRLVTNRAEFLASFSEADLNYLVERWEMKERFCRAAT